MASFYYAAEHREKAWLCCVEEPELPCISEEDTLEPKSAVP